MIQRKLSCGVTLAAEQLPGFRSVTVGIWTGAGSVTETAEENGISHLIEHMLFKGTSHRTAKEIAQDVDRIGGQINAFTSKEATCYYIKVMDEKLEQGIEILTDLFCNALLSREELEREKGVVLEEIAMSNDQPDDVVMDLIASRFFQGCPLERTILGPPENIRRFAPEDLRAYMDRYYAPENIVVAAAGNFDEDALCGALERGLERVGERAEKCPDFAALETFAYEPKTAFQEKDIEQVQICLGLPCCSFRDRRKRSALNVMGNILGGSMSSRLFQRVREEKGLAYSIYSQPMYYRDAGMFTIYAGTMPQNAEEVTGLILEELEKLRRSGVTRAEFEQSKQMLKGNYILSLEASSSRMSQLARNVLVMGRPYSEEEMIRAIEQVTMEEVAGQIEEVIQPALLSGAFVGRASDGDAFRRILACA